MHGTRQILKSNVFVVAQAYSPNHVHFDNPPSRRLARNSFATIFCSHNVLCSGTASGELHVWDASTGAFIFGVAARHPNNPGLTAMSTNEGPVEGGGGLNADTSEGPSGRGGGDSGGDGFGVGATRASPAAVRSTTPVAGGRSNLMLFTACEEGFVKTWRLGEQRVNQIIVREEVLLHVVIYRVFSQRKW